MSIFESVMLPVIFIFATGFVFQKIFNLEIKPLSTLAISLLLPFLTFQTFYKNAINTAFYFIIVVLLLSLIALVILGIIVGKSLHFKRSQIDALLLASCFPNSGNYGVPIVMFAFGHKGLLYGLPIMIFHNLLMGTVGVYIAADKQGNVLGPLKQVFKQPMNYVILPAILMNKFQLILPVNFMKSITLIGNTTVPIIMLILGMQLASVQLVRSDWNKIWLASVLRLMISPLIVYFICQLLPINATLTAILVVMSAMPSAANTTLYAIQFAVEPQFVAINTLISTLFSILTLTVLLNFIG
ncbi:AEC family transporter [Liquorilactobacillus satsumensis]|uniref:AEC family transporter n=1 Tax=Liquorilactobacillus satsumensis DSM 16230 = JCM 12392 TaxID=1423801 RepID=A0A0R1UVF0_9LACO|nr:AEC family transporter [Liquorilactobacillus satsumensis]KRL96974.1 hypothetical protein FD50_GL001919 [Liquorilactobacillus satsumensis DSM 16230 = JCM 12392]